MIIELAKRDSIMWNAIIIARNGRACQSRFPLIGKIINRIAQELGFPRENSLGRELEGSALEILIAGELEGSAL
jgi:hypothetical protein